MAAGSLAGDSGKPGRSERVRKVAGARNREGSRNKDTNEHGVWEEIGRCLMCGGCASHVEGETRRRGRHRMRVGSFLFLSVIPRPLGFTAPLGPFFISSLLYLL